MTDPSDKPSTDQQYDDESARRQRLLPPQPVASLEYAIETLRVEHRGIVDALSELFGSTRILDANLASLDRAIAILRASEGGGCEP